MIAPNLRWPLVLFAIPFAAVIFGIFIVLVAQVFPDDVVVDDYYKDGMSINRRIDQDARAVELGIRLADISYSNRVATFHIEGADEAGLALGLFHVTDQGLDRDLVLTRRDEFLYVVQGESVAIFGEEGVWYLEIASQERDWKLRSRISTPLAAREVSDE